MPKKFQEDLDRFEMPNNSIIVTKVPIGTYLDEVSYFIKHNTNCPASEKVGGEHPCSGGRIEKNSQENFIGFNANHNYKGVDTTNIRRSDLIKVTDPELHKNLNKLSQDLNDQTTSREKLILGRYTNNGYMAINDYLSNKLEQEVGSESSILRRAKEDTEDLDKIFKKANLSIPMTTFRGIKDEILTNNPDLQEALDTPGSEINCSCFSSSSVLPFVAENFASGYSSRMLEIKLPKGSKAIYLSEVSTSPSEFEVLINRNTRFEVGETKSVNIINPYKKKNDRYVKVTTLKAII